MSKKYQYYKGLKFTRDDKTGYYLNSTNKIRMHRYVWECNYGAIPEGYHIHHIDHDKSNNNIENLKLMKADEHMSLHGQANGIANVESGLLERIRPMTKEWHASDEGHKWHKEHYEKTKDKLHAKKEFKCDNCGKVFVGPDNSLTRFCSNACKSAYRRKTGKDLIEKECVICGNKFKTNKYRPGRTCSRKCAGKLRTKNKKD